MAFPSHLFLGFGDQFKTYTDERFPIGSVGILPDGTMFRFVQNNASNAMVAGDLQQAAVASSNHILQTPTAAAVGDTKVVVALGNTAVLADEYKYGVLAIELGTGFGYRYTIDTHPAVAASGSFTVPLAGAGPANGGTGLVVAGNESVQVAIPATANSVSLIRNPWKFPLVFPTTPTGVPVGVAVKPLAASAYGWVCTHGLCLVTTQGTVVVGNDLVPSGTTAGSVSPFALTEATPNTGAGQFVVGRVAHVASTTNKTTAFLTID